MAAFLIPFLIAIISKIVEHAAWTAVMVAIIFACLWLLATDFGKWAFEQLLDLLIYMLKGFSIDLSFLSPSKYVSIPPEVSNMLGLLGIDTALGIILAAILVKIVLQLIPFTRLGS
nr:DUF2523 family protein [uncultured Deefgea sp.]